MLSELQNKFSLRIASWNCHGIKSSVNYADTLVSMHHVTFFSEHWLLPHELNGVKCHFSSQCKSVYFKSSVDVLDRICGRPYGGLGFVCDLSNGLSYIFEECASDRICGVKVLKNGHIILVIYGVYLPCDDRTNDSLDLYSDTLDQLQSLIDAGDPTVPVIVVGDMNASLPKAELIPKTWYKKYPYSKRSLLLYEFLSDSECVVANFLFKQPCDYTYFRNNTKSYIDHVFIPGHLVDKVKNCTIIQHTPDNVSDHLPLSTTLDCLVTAAVDGNSCSNYEDFKQYAKGKWDNLDFQQMYHATVDANLKLHDNKVLVTKDNALDIINKRYSQLCDVLHKSVDSCLQIIRPSKCNRNFKNKKWWNQDCARAKRRNSIFHYIWKQSGKPSFGSVYENYKYAKKHYRKMCRLAANDKIKIHFSTMDKLYESRNSKQLFNVIRKTKSKNDQNNNISIGQLTDYLTAKFSSEPAMTDYVVTSSNVVEEKYRRLCETPLNIAHSCSAVIISESQIKRYIKQLKGGTAAGEDGITTEHLRYAVKTNLPLYLSQLFSLCLQFGEVPDAFRSGILVPLLKKSNIDPTVPKNYRPITISAVLSKILEFYIIEKCAGYEYNQLQFGFVPGRSTAMATSLVHDVCEFSKASGSNVFMCSLDAEAAYDGIPHPVLFDSASNILPDVCWKILYNWYTCLSVRVKWQNTMGKQIKVVKGLRQGGLTSPLLYNVFYQPLVDSLSTCDAGITINNVKYNVFCYADDLLLTSTTITGLQTLIDLAVSHVTQRGLQFNPVKTVCMSYSQHSFVDEPRWTINGTILNNESVRPSLL